MNYFCVLTLYDDSTKTKSLSMECVVLYNKYDLLKYNKPFKIAQWFLLEKYVNSFKSNFVYLFYVQYFNYIIITNTQYKSL